MCANVENQKLLNYIKLSGVFVKKKIKIKWCDIG